MIHPYRAERTESSERLRVHPGVATRFVVLVLLLVSAPALLHALLWSRVVDIVCEENPYSTLLDSFTCEVRDYSLVGGGLARVEFSRPTDARLAGAVDGFRGDAWIEVAQLITDNPSLRDHYATVRLTNGFNLAKGDQARVADALTRFLHSGETRFAASFGSRWKTLPVPLLAFAAALLWYAVLGVRLTLVRRERLGTLEVELRCWPLPGRQFGFELRHVTGVELGGDPSSRMALYRRGPNLMLRLASGDLVRLAFVIPGRAIALRDRVDAFRHQGGGA